MKNLPPTLADFHVLWATYLMSPSSDVQAQILQVLDTLREQSGLTDSEWEEFTLTLSGFDAWWERVRIAFLDEAKQGLEDG